MWGFACVFVFTVQGSLVPDQLVVENSIAGKKGVGQAKDSRLCPQWALVSATPHSWSKPVQESKA